MATRKKKAPVAEIDESALVTEPEIAPEGALFADVAYEHRGHHEPHECCGVTFEPGHVLTFRSAGDVPQAMRDDPALQIRAAKMGACRLQVTLRYVPMTEPEFDVLVRARGTMPRFEEAEVVADSDQPEPDAPESEPVTIAGGEELYPPDPEGDE